VRSPSFLRLFTYSGCDGFPALACCRANRDRTPRILSRWLASHALCTTRRRALAFESMGVPYLTVCCWPRGPSKPTHATICPRTRLEPHQMAFASRATVLTQSVSIRLRISRAEQMMYIHEDPAPWVDTAPCSYSGELSHRYSTLAHRFDYLTCSL
jgi:hypothetical protein